MSAGDVKDTILMMILVFIVVVVSICGIKSCSQQEEDHKQQFQMEKLKRDCPLKTIKE